MHSAIASANQSGDIMEKTIIDLPSTQLIGITARTNNKAEISWETGKIWPCVRRYFHEQLALKIPNRKNPGTTFCAYTEYDSEACPLGFHPVTIPSQTYIKFTNGPAPMPEVVREPWLKIWAMTPQDLGGIRRFETDFEIYDERAADHQNVVLDVLIGIK